MNPPRFEVRSDIHMNLRVPNRCLGGFFFQKIARKLWSEPNRNEPRTERGTRGRPTSLPRVRPNWMQQVKVPLPLQKEENGRRRQRCLLTKGFL